MAEPEITDALRQPSAAAEMAELLNTTHPAGGFPAALRQLCTMAEDAATRRNRAAPGSLEVHLVSDDSLYVTIRATDTDNGIGGTPLARLKCHRIEGWSVVPYTEWAKMEPWLRDLVTSIDEELDHRTDTDN